MTKFELSASRYILINTALKSLHFYKANRLVASYLVAVGKSSTPTPSGHFKVVTKIYNPGGILGTRWLGLTVAEGNYGIHGTNNPSSIGSAVSNGCIRMHNESVEELFSMVHIGTPVLITDEVGYPNLFWPEDEQSNSAYQGEAEEFYENIPQESLFQEEEVPEPVYEYVEQEDAQPSPAEGFYYTIQPGDTLWTISRRFGLPIKQILDVNTFTNPNILYPGEIIFIPQTGNQL